MLVWLLVAAAWCTFIMWLVGRIVNDRLHVTQYLFWMPPPFVLADIAACLGCASLFNLFLTRSKLRRAGIRAGWCAGAIVLTATAVQWNLHRYLLLAAQPSGATVRVMAWNPATDFIKDFAERVVAEHPRIMAITNRPAYTNWQMLQDEVGGARSMVRYAHLSVVSAYRVLEWGGTRLGVKGAVKRTTLWQGGGEVSQDQGEALYCILDTREVFGRTSVLWMLDLPSDPNLSRDIVFSEADETLRTFQGPRYSRTERNLDQEKLPGADDAGFPSPDLIMGDFNTPRGSHSISRVARGLAHAYDLAGRGWSPTWRRDYPFIAIDQTFVAPWMRVTAYEIKDLGAGWHRTQILDLESLVPPAAGVQERKNN
jgi:hypothetical protein